VAACAGRGTNVLFDFDTTRADAPLAGESIQVQLPSVAASDPEVDGFLAVEVA
jgi:hypothetical protein